MLQAHRLSQSIEQQLPLGGGCLALHQLMDVVLTQAVILAPAFRIIIVSPLFIVDSQSVLPILRCNVPCVNCNARSL